MAENLRYQQRKCFHFDVLAAREQNAQKHFRFSVTSPHPTAKPSWGWLRVGVRKPRLVLVGIIATCNKVTAKARAGVLGCTPHGGAGAIPCAAPYGALPPRDSHRGHSFPSRPRTRDLECALAGGEFSRRGLLVVLRLLLTTKREKKGISGGVRSLSCSCPLVL